MDTLVVDLQPNQTTSFLIGEAIDEGDRQKKQDAPELAALEASSVACATTESTTEYTPEADVCQVAAIPSFDEIETLIAGAAKERIANTYRELEATRARIGRERIARDRALEAAQTRIHETQAAQANLQGERAKMEERARAFLGGQVLKAVLEKIHLAFNARQLELETELKDAEVEVAQAQAEGQATNLTDALELQLAEGMRVKSVLAGLTQGQRQRWLGSNCRAPEFPSGNPSITGSTVRSQYCLSYWEWGECASYRPNLWLR